MLNYTMAQLVEVKEIDMALAEQKNELNEQIEKQIQAIVELKQNLAHVNER
jgi:hypothetical protein